MWGEPNPHSQAHTPSLVTMEQPTWTSLDYLKEVKTPKYSRQCPLFLGFKFFGVLGFRESEVC